MRKSKIIKIRPSQRIGEIKKLRTLNLAQVKLMRKHTENSNLHLFYQNIFKDAGKQDAGNLNGKIPV